MTQNPGYLPRIYTPEAVIISPHGELYPLTRPPRHAEEHFLFLNREDLEPGTFALALERNWQQWIPAFLAQRLPGTAELSPQGVVAWHKQAAVPVYVQDPQSRQMREMDLDFPVLPARTQQEFRQAADQLRSLYYQSHYILLLKGAEEWAARFCQQLKPEKAAVPQERRFALATSLKGLSVRQQNLLAVLAPLFIISEDPAFFTGAGLARQGDLVLAIGGGQEPLENCRFAAMVVLKPAMVERQAVLLEALERVIDQWVGFERGAWQEASARDSKSAAGRAFLATHAGVEKPGALRGLLALGGEKPLDLLPVMNRLYDSWSESGMAEETILARFGEALPLCSVLFQHYRKREAALLAARHAVLLPMPTLDPAAFKPADVLLAHWVHVPAAASFPSITNVQWPN